MEEVEKRMRVLWALGYLPTEPAVASLDDDQWDYLHFFVNKFEGEKAIWFQETLNRILGTIITSEDIQNISNKPRYLSDKPEQPDVLPTKIFTPLLWGMAPRVLEHARKVLSPIPDSLGDERFFTRNLGKKQGQVLRTKKAEVEGFELSKQDFLASMQHIITVAAGKESLVQQKRKELKRAELERKARIARPTSTNVPPSRLPGR